MYKQNINDTATETKLLCCNSTKYSLIVRSLNIMRKHPASEYRELRSKYFGIINKHGLDKAFYILEKDHEKIIHDDRIYTGLFCELVFFKEYGSNLGLTPGLDCGDHCDFSGLYNNQSARFDVTSSLEYKDLVVYEPFQKQGYPYYIALVNSNEKKVEKIIDINFPFCPICKGRMLNIIVEENEQTDQGTPSPTQRILTLCSNDYAHVKMVNDYNYQLPSITDMIDSIESDKTLNPKLINRMITEVINTHGCNNSLFFSKLSGKKIHACGKDRYQVMAKDGDGCWETELYWRADIVRQLLPSSLGIVVDEYL